MVIGNLNERILGRTGLKVKSLGFGGIPIQSVSEDEAIQVVRRCYELGINYFDTARGYTVSEEVLQELKASLKNLRTDWVDVYQLHNVASKETLEQIKSPGGALEALYKAQDEGKILHLGVTSHLRNSADQQKIRRIIGLLPENVGLYDDLSAYKNLDIYGPLYKCTEEQRIERIEYFLKMLELC